MGLEVDWTGPDRPLGPPFELLPAIDLRGGRVVRLVEGDFERETVYANDPAEQARRFADLGARWLHVVDLDAARTGEPANAEDVRAIVDAVGDRVAVEVGGGLRSHGAVSAVLDLGAARAVVGTAAIADPAFAAALVERHGAERIAVAVDVRDGRAVGEGWRAGASGTPLETLLPGLADAGIATVEVTSIRHDGGLRGPDLALLARIVGERRLAVIASAGISTLADIETVRALGCRGAIVGKALYDGRLDLRAALATTDPSA